MNGSRKLTVMVAFCLAVFGISLWDALQHQSAGAFALAGTAFVLLVAIYAVGVLDYKVGGATISLERRVRDLEGENRELRAVATALVKCLLVTSEGATRLGGPSRPHRELVREYIEPIEHHLEKGLIDATEAVIRERVDRADRAVAAGR